MASSLKTKYLQFAFGVVALLSLLVGSFAYIEHRIDAATISRIANGTVAKKLEADLEGRARTLSRISTPMLAAALNQGDSAATAAVAERLVRQTDVARVEVLDSRGTVVFARGDTLVPGSKLGPYTLQTPIRFALGGGAVRRVGTLQLWMSRADIDAALADLRAALAQQRSLQATRVLGGLLGFISVLLLLALPGAWFVARELARPIAALVGSADRIGRGDYSRPLAVARRDELGELQAALERMRQKLRETTITKNYLNTVLNSLSDAVLVTSPDGIVKGCNEAARRLLGYAEEQMHGKPLVDFVDPPHRPAFDPRLGAAEARETVLRTASGQTIPVSIAGSPISTEDPQFQGNIYVARNITERKRAERRIRYLARYDTLTKMPNRMQFQHLLQQAIARARRNQRALALLYLDLDRFKEVNDTFGHAAGDRTLEILTERLTRTLEQGRGASDGSRATNSRCSSTTFPPTSTIARASARSRARCSTRSAARST